MHENAAALVAEESRGGVRYIERAEQMNFDHQFEISDAHLVKDCIAQNAGIVDDAVELAEMIERRLHYGRGGGGFGHRVEVRHRHAAFLPDQLHYLLDRTAALAAAVGGTAEIVDDHLAPSAAASSAISRPIPRPAPVTITALPFNAAPSAILPPVCAENQIRRYWW
jgi:hypothetical protein